MERDSGREREREGGGGGGRDFDLNLSFVNAQACGAERSMNIYIVTQLQTKHTKQKSLTRLDRCSGGGVNMLVLARAKSAVEEKKSNEHAID